MKTRVILVLMLLWTALPAQPAGSDEPRYTADGQLMRPDAYREWGYLSSGLGRTSPQAYKAFLQTGAWLDKTLFALEVRYSATKGSTTRAATTRKASAH